MGPFLVQGKPCHHDIEGHWQSKYSPVFPMTPVRVVSTIAMDEVILRVKCRNWVSMSEEYVATQVPTVLSLWLEAPEYLIRGSR